MAASNSNSKNPESYSSTVPETSYQDTEEVMALARNLKYEIVDDVLVLRINLNAERKLSDSKKSLNIAGPLGWGLDIPDTADGAHGQLTLALQLRVPNPEYVAEKKAKQSRY